MTKSLLQNSFYLVFMGVFTGFIQLNAQTPGGIASTNIKLWIKADSGITNVSGVKQWNDLGPAGKHLVQNTSTARPVYNTTSNLMNYNPTVKFDGSDDFMSVTSGLLGTATYNNMNIFMVRNVPSWTGAVNFSEKCNPYRLMAHTPYGSDVYWDAGHYVAPYRQSVAWGGTFGVPQQYTMTFDVTPTKSQTIRRNGRQLISDATSAVIKGTNQPFYLGRWSDGGYHDNSFVTEYIQVGGILTATERLKIESYLAIKYGISIDQTTATNYLSSAGATVWDGTANSGNKNNITGIGRDNGSGLYQKQSRSVNTANSGNMVWMGLNTIATTNTANTGTLADNSFMIWGDNGSAGTQTSEVPSSLTNGGCVSVQRMVREWKVQETGTVGAVQVKFNLNGFTSATTTQSELKLLIDDDGNFGNGGTTIVEATSYDPVTKELTFDNVNFTTGQFFTVVLDLAPSSPGGVSSGLQFWLKADKGVIVNGSNNFTTNSSGTWLDQSPNGRHIDYSYGTQKWIDSSINFNPSVYFDGSGWLRIDNPTRNTFYTSFTSGDVFSVLKQNDINNRAYPYYIGGASFGHHYTWSNAYIYSGYGTNIRKSWLPNSSPVTINTGECIGCTSQSPAVNTLHFQLMNQHSATNNWKTAFNGRTQIQTSTNTVNFVNYGNVHLGAYPGLGNWYGNLPEVINYNRVLSDAEKNQVNSYLAVKYGLTLDQTVAQNYAASGGSPIFWNAGTNTIYKNNIIGIGRDDCGGLYQKQSRGSLTGTETNMVGIGLDTIKSSNLANKSTFSVDESFLMIAHDGTTGTKTTELPTSFANPCITYTRTNKEWRVQKTGTVGTMNVRLYYGDLSIYSDDISEFKLIIDGDADFSNATTIVSASSINTTGKYVDFYGVNLTDGQFFTFMVDQAASAPGGVFNPTASEINGVKYDLYTGLETVTDGIQSPLRSSGYVSTLTNPDDLVLNEIYDYFTMKLTTNLKIVNPGQYQFRFLAADDNVQLLINGVNYMNRTCCGDVTGANITLTAGNHLLEVRFSEYVGAETLNLQWRAAATGLDVTTTWQSIAENKLYLTSAPTLSAWYRADKNVTATGNGVIASGWKDQSPNGNNVTTRPGYNPTYYNTTSAQLQNYNPSILFTDDQMYSSDNPTGFAFGKQGKTKFAVFSKTTFNGGNGVLSALGQDNCTNCSFWMYNAGANVGLDGWNTGIVSAGAITSSESNVPKLFTGTYLNNTITPTNNAILYSAGRQLTTGSMNWNTTLNDNEDFSIGYHNDLQWDGHDGKIMEIIEYPWTLTTTERQRVESYLAIKYGISMDQTVATNYVDGAGAIIWNATTMAAHNKNITGIGRDDCSGLKQKQSKSVNTTNTGHVVAIGRDTISNSNGENNANFTADKSFLIWGDDNGGVTEVSTEIPTVITAGAACVKGKRIAREWRVAVTNYSEHNLVQFNLARLGLTTRATGEFKLMVDADGDFTNGATLYSATSKVDSFLNFDNITFTNGQYFSLLTSDDESTGPGGVTSGLSRWYKADVGATSLAWEDAAAGTGHHTTSKSGTITWKSTGLNYNPYITFAQSGYFFAPSAFINNQSGDFKAFSVNIPKAADYNTLWGQRTTNANNIATYTPHLNGRMYFDAPFGHRIDEVFTTMGGIIDLPLVSRVSKKAGVMSIFFGGKQVLTGSGFTSNFNGISGVNDANSFLIGAQNGIAGGANTAEIILYENASSMTATDVQKIESYLALKYGTTLNQSPKQNYLASNGTTKFYDTALMTIYTSNIAGIGRDLCSGLHQKQSRSVNRSSGADSIVAMGLGEIYTSNLDNPDTLTNLNFMMWADDGVAGTQTTEVPSALTNGGCILVKRLAREWRVQETGTVGAVQVQMNLGGVIPQSTEIGDIRLLIDNDNNFGNGGTTIVTPTDYNETTRVATFDNINFTNGQFFTIVTNIAAGGPGGVITATGDVNGVKYDLYSGYDANLTDGLQGTTLLQSGYTNNLTNFDDIVLNDINDNFTMVATTRISITNAGTYQFQFNALDNYGAIYINGVLNASYSTPAACCPNVTGTNIALAAGFHTIEVRGSESTGAETYYVQWRGTTAGLDVGTSFVDIADNKLFLPSAPSISSWHRADKGIDNTGEGTAVTSWEDQSANGVDLITGSGTPLYYKTTSANLNNYNPNILFTSDYLKSVDNPSGFAYGKQAKTTFSVMAKPVYNAGGGWVSAWGQDNCSGCSFGTLTTGADIGVTAWTAANDVYSTGYLLATDNSVPKLLMGSYANSNITATNNMSIWANGTQRNIATRSANTTTLNDLEDYSIGLHNQGQGGAVNHNIMEVINYPWVLSFAERQRVNSYLAIKYGITLDTTYVASDATAIWNDVTNAGYGNNIAGIGLDSCSGLNQKQSRSVNPVNDGFMVAIGNYAIANSNSENTNNFSADKTFMVWGDDGTTGVKTTEVPTASLDPDACRTYKRLNREWKVQETGTVGDVELRFYLGTTYSSSSSASGDFKLLVKNNSNDFSTGAVTVYNATNWDVTSKYVTFSNINFANNDYFTIITDITSTNPGGVTYTPGDGSVGNPYKTIYDASSNTSAGIKNFNINGNAFTTYVDASGYVLVGSGNDASDEVGYGTTTTLTLQSDLVLTSGILRVLDVNQIRMNNTGGGAALNVTTSNGDMIDRLVNNQQLSVAAGDQAAWSGTGSNLMTVTCAPVANTLANRIWHACGNATHLHWLPNDGSGGTTGDGFASSADDADLNLWVRNTSHPMTAWYRADKGVTIATGVSLWEDQGINARNATQATVANQSAYNTTTNLINFNPSLNADGTDDFMTFSSIGAVIGGGARSVYGVSTTSSTNATFRYLTSYGTPSVTGELFGLGRESAISRTVGWSADHDVAGVWTATNEPELVYADYNGTQARGAFNGGTITGTTRTWTTRHNSNDLGYIAARSGGEHWSGRIGEIIHFNYVLSATDNQKLNSYLALKYGLTLNQTTAQDYLASDGTTKMWNATANATYKNRIAGLGRDDCSGLYQKQSQSQVGISDTTLLSMALGAFVASNADNLNTIDSNRTFLVWGDDNGALAEQSTEMPTALNTNGVCNQGLRIGREWKVQQTANKEIGYVQLKMDIDALGLNLRDSTKFRLVLNSTSDFTTATTFVVPNLFENGILTFDNMQFTDTVTYLTLVTDTTLTIAPGGVASGLRLWLKADAGITGAAPVTAWADQSTNALTAARQGSGALNLLSNGINYNPAINFPGGANYFTIPSNTLLDPSASAGLTVFGVVNPTFNSNYKPIMAKTNSAAWDNGWILSDNGNANAQIGFVWGNWSGTGSGNTALQSFPQRVPYIATGNYNSTTFNNVSSNAKAFTSLNVSTTSSVGNVIGIGSDGYGNYHEGPYGEVIYYGVNLSNTDRQKVHSYLGLKYGITIDQTSPQNYLASDGTTTMWTATGGDNPLFSKNIAGIGRDYCSGLYQKQSRSVNRAAVEDSMVAMGLSTLEASNADNNSLIDSNLSFMLWGDNGRTGTIITDVPTAALDPLACKTFKRLNREWKVQETKTVGTVALRFYLGTTYTNSASTAADFKLLIDVDTIFANTTNIVSATSYDATNKYVEFSYNFTNNDYFTLVLDNAVAPGGVGTNLARWYRADKGVTVSGANVTAWDDQSVSARNATGVNNPVYNTTTNLLNFNPTISFNSNQHFTFSDVGLNAGTNSRTMLSVGTSSTIDAASRFIYAYGTAGVGGQLSGLARSTAAQHTVGWGLDHIISSVWNNTTNLRMVYGDYNGTQARGAFDGGSISGTNFAWNTTLTGTGFIGGRSGGDYWLGRIPEVINYNGLLSATELQRVNSYLAIKYGKTLSQTTAQNYLASDGTTKIWNATSADNPSYKNRITGIGRDDCSGLSQKQSMNQDTIAAVSVVTIGLDTIKTTNALNDGEFINNLAFLAWGDDNGSLAEQTTEVPTIINVGTCGAGKRIGREWKVQKTGTVDAVQMKFDITTTNISTRPASQFRLAVHTSNDFTSATTFYRPSSFTSGVLTFDGVTISNDSAYMTIITDTIVNVGPGGVVANLAQWLRADMGTTIATGVSAWDDQGGANRDAAQATGANQPILTANALNYNPVLTFNGTSQQMTFSDIGLSSGSANRSSFTVASNNSMTATFRYINFYGTNAANNGFGLAKNATSNGYDVVGWTNNHTIASIWTTANRYRMVYGDYNGTQARGAVEGGSITVTARTWNTILTGTGYIGSNPINERWSGNIGEVIQFNSVLGATDRQKVNSYLALKYGLTLDQGIPGVDYLASNGSVIWTGNSTYKFNIAGIGLDSCSALNQKQSRSADTTQRGDVVAIGKGTIATDNASNGVLFDANRDFFVWGADSARGFKNTEFPASITSQACVSVTRLQKEWKTQLTGTASQSTQVKFFLAGLIPASTSILDLKLLVDTVDAVFDNGGTRIIDAATYNETTQEVTFDNVVFKNNNYFTLLIDVYAIAPGGVTSGIQAWLRADKGVITETGASQWNDQSTNNRVAVQATAINQPSYLTTSNLLNFNPNLTFNGSTHRMTFGHNLGITADVEVNLFGVINKVGNTGTDCILGTTTQTANKLEWNTTTANVLTRNGGTVATGATTLTPGSTFLVGAKKNAGATSPNQSVFINGKLDGSVAGSTWSIVDDTRVLGSASSAGINFFEGRLGDIAVYVGALTSIERNRIESYMALKYGITLDQTGTTTSYRASFGTIIWDSAVNTAYKSRIFGIGRDYCSGLYQKQARSALSGNILTLSLNTMATSNAINTGALAKDSMFTIIGDNDSTLTQQSSDLPTSISSCASRLKREWKAQVTGDPVEAEYRFDLSTATGIGTTLTDFRIIIDEDGNGDFTNGAVRIFDASSFASNIVTFADLKINNGEVFTLVTKGATLGEVALTTTSTKVTSLSDGCSVNGWTYYTDPVDTTKLVIAIFNNGNTVNVDSITINTGNGFTDADLSKGRKTPNERAVSIMKRLIQVNAPGIFSVNGGVKVRLYYDQAEVDDVTTRMNQLKTDSNIVGATIPFQWFKTKKTIPQIISTMTALGVDPGTPDSTRVSWPLAGDSSGIENGIKFIQLHGIKTFSSFGGGVSVGNSTPLPVELLEFKGEKREDASHLSWKTASEKNVEKFDIERTTQPSANNWEKLGEVAAVGNSQFIQQYSFVDLYPEKAINYYRLKTIDFDNHTEYSKTIAIDYRKLGLSNITVYPNPVSESFFIDAKGHDKETISLKLYDALGRVVWSESYEVNGTYDKREFVRPVTATSGVYMLKIVNESTEDENSVQIILK